MNSRSFKAYAEEDMEIILGRLSETAQRLGVTPEELVVQAFTQNGKPVPQKTVDCFTIEELEKFWPSIDILQTWHMRDCLFCQELIKVAFPGFLADLDSGFVREIGQVTRQFTGKCPSCYSMGLQVGDQRFYPFPLRKDLAHVQQCLFCQLLIHYHRDKERERLGFGCLDMNGWRIYPLFHPNDLHHITEHVIKTCHCVIGNEKCSGRAVLRFRFNALKDRLLFQQLKRQPVSQLQWKLFINKLIKKPIGDVISSCRFHRSMFAKKHPWSIWKNEDGLLRLLTEDNLSFEERLYRELLEHPEREQELIDRLVATFPGYKPWDWTYKLPDRPLLWNRATIIDFLRLETESHRRGISVEELKALEAEEDRRIDEEIEATLRAREARRHSI